jgi:4-hydroxyacetophenone monooxygenase
VTTTSCAPVSELIGATDSEIEAAVALADPMVLRGTLYQLTGDEEIANLPTELVTFGYVRCWSMVDEDALATLRAKAVAFLVSHRDAGVPDLGSGPAERLHRSLELTSGESIPDEDTDLWIEQLAIDPWCRSVTINDPVARQRAEGFLVAVIGAGMGGLNSAIQLKRAGIPFVVIEKNTEVGGTWYTNRYPGARVDSASRIYSHVYALDYEFPNMFCAQPENEKYYNWMADEFDVRSSIDFGAEVTSMDWDEEAGVWNIDATAAGGKVTYRPNAVISSVGPFTRYSMPQVPGRERFEGRSFHTAEWPADLDISGKRVAVVGSGCTGYQLAPVVAKEAEHTFLLQRTPNWCFEVDGYVSPLPLESLWLDRNLPLHVNFLRFRLDWLVSPSMANAVFGRDPEFSDEHALSELNKLVREQRLEFLQDRLGDRPDLLEAMTPVAPPFTARPVVVDSKDSVFDAMVKDDFSLVTSNLVEVDETGIQLANGDHIDVDVIAYATGYRPNDFLWPMEVTGVDGRRLEDLWAEDGARAYVGTMLPGFPNLFLVYGPNTNPTNGLTVIDFEEMVARFALECVRGLLEGGFTSVDVSQEAFDRYNAEVDRSIETMVYTDKRANNYYRNEHGRASFNCAIDGRWMWAWLRSPVEPREDTPQYAGIEPFFGKDLQVR